MFGGKKRRLIGLTLHVLSLLVFSLSEAAQPDIVKGS